MIVTHSYSMRRKFRSQTSDNMDRWKGRAGKSQRREEKKNEDQRKERVRGKKIQVCEKVGKSRNAMFFQCFVAPEGRKVGSLKRRVRRCDLKSCTPLWREAHFEVKSVKNWRSQTTFANFCKLRCRKSTCRCGAKHISKSKCTKHTRVGAPLEVEMSKKCTSLWREAHVQVKCTKHLSFGALLELEMLKKCTPLWREAYFQVKMLKTPHVRTTFRCSDIVLRGKRGGLCTLSKVSKKTWRFCSSVSYNHHYTTLHSTPLRHNYNYNYTTFHQTPLHSTPLHHTTLR